MPARHGAGDDRRWRDDLPVTIATPLADAALANEQARHAEIDALQAALTGIQAQLDAALAVFNADQTNIVDLTGQVTAAQDQITALQAQVANLQAQVVAIQATLDPFPLPPLTTVTPPTLATDLDYYRAKLVPAPTFIDDFAGPALDRTKWITRLPWGGLADNTLASGGRGLPANHEAEYYGDKQDAAVTPNLPDPFTIANSVLRITAQPSTDLVATRNQPYLSGEISTYSSFAQLGGLFEICCRMSRRAGFWPAFWLLQPLPLTWPPEIDVFEYLNGIDGGLTKIHSGVIYPGSTSSAWYNVGVDLSAGYHLYSLAWTADQLIYYFDGKEIRRTDIPAGQLAAPLYLIANLAVGGPGSWPGVPAAFAKDCLDIDFIRAYQWAGSAPLAPRITVTAHSATAGAIMPARLDGGTWATSKILTPTPTAYVYNTKPAWKTLQLRNNGGGGGTITVDGITHTDGTVLLPTPKAIGVGQSFTWSH